MLTFAYIAARSCAPLSYNEGVMCELPTRGFPVGHGRFAPALAVEWEGGSKEPKTPAGGGRGGLGGDLITTGRRHSQLGPSTHEGFHSE